MNEINQIKPKFAEGDWVVHNYPETWYNLKGVIGVVCFGLERYRNQSGVFEFKYTVNFAGKDLPCWESEIKLISSKQE